MANEITIKDIWDKMESMRTELKGDIARLEVKVDDNVKAFHTFEAGRVTQLIQDVAVLKTQKEQLEKKDAGYDKEAEKRKDWIWGALEKIIFMLIIPLIALILIRTGIINIK